jgi:kumamolisin
VGYATGTDGGSGIASRLLQRSSAVLTGTTCGTYGSFATVTGGTDPVASPIADSVTGGNCYKYQYVVTDKVGNSHTATSTSVVKVSAPCAIAQLLQNPGFESGNNGAWTESTGGQVTNGGGVVPPRTGTWNGWLGGWGSAVNDSLTQQVTIPANCAVTLSYWLRVTTYEGAGAGVLDTFAVRVTSGGNTSQVGPTYSNADAGGAYVQRTVVLSAYAGQTVTLRFTTVENASVPTHFSIDDLALTTGPIG